MANGFVQQDAGPAGAEHHAHLAGRGGPGFEIGQRSLDRVIHIGIDLGFIKISQAEAAATAARADLPAGHTGDFLLGNHRHAQAHQRPHIGCQCAVSTRHQHHVVFAGQAGHDLHNTRVLGLGEFFNPLQQLDFGGAVQGGNRVNVPVKRTAAGDLARRGLDTAGPVGSRDGAHGAGGIEQGGFGNIIRVSKRRFFAADGAHADTLVNAEGARFDNALFQAPAFAAGVLKVKVCVVHAIRRNFAEGAAQMSLAQSERRQQEFVGNCQTLGRGIHLHSGTGSSRTMVSTGRGRGFE